jgi:hypothetical protein
MKAMLKQGPTKQIFFPSDTNLKRNDNLTCTGEVRCNECVTGYHGTQLFPTGTILFSKYYINLCMHACIHTHMYLFLALYLLTPPLLRNEFLMLCFKTVLTICQTVRIVAPRRIRTDDKAQKTGRKPGSKL